MVELLLVVTAVLAWLAAVIFWGHIFNTRWQEIVEAIPGVRH